jgi:hypothetical protein
MPTSTEQVRAILHEIVNDLAKTAAGVSVLASRLQISKADAGDANTLALKADQKYYDALRSKIDALK